jgi:hypothetical protein
MAGKTMLASPVINPLFGKTMEQAPPYALSLRVRGSMLVDSILVLLRSPCRRLHQWIRLMELMQPAMATRDCWKELLKLIENEK